MAKYIIREVNDSDMPGIVRLRLDIKEFRSIIPEEYISFWNSLIKYNPCSIRKVLVAVDDQNKIVAHYAMVPFKFLREGELLLGGFLCQLMVDEKYRQELVFPRMEMKFIKAYKESGIDFVFSLGNREKVVKAHLSFGFRKVGDLPVYARPYKLAGISQRLITNRLLKLITAPGLSIAEKALRLRGYPGESDLTVDEITEFDSSVDHFIEKVQSRFPYCALRNSAILNWRFADPAARYRKVVAKEAGDIVGYAVLRRIEMKQFDILAVVDILFSPERSDAGKTLLNAVHKTAVQLNVEMSACLLNPHDPLCSILKKCGYYKTPESFSLFVHEPKGTSLQFKEDSFNKWHLTWFDNDAV